MGDTAEQSRLCHNIQLGAASSQIVIDHLEESTLLIVTSSRDELIVTASSLHHIPEYKARLAGLIIGGHVPVSSITQQILEDSRIPYIRIKETSSDISTSACASTFPRSAPRIWRKIDLIN